MHTCNMDRHIVKYKSLCQRAWLQNQSLQESRLGDVLKSHSMSPKKE